MLWRNNNEAETPDAIFDFSYIAVLWKGETCKSYGRPVFCTEWMARTDQSRFETHLPVMKKNKVAAYNWGLVAGKTQTYMPRRSKEGSPEPEEWFHDIFRKDGTPYDAREVEFIKKLIKIK